MIVRTWGSRGSIAVSGKEYLKYGGDTTCLEIVSNRGDIIIIDAGTGIRALGNKLIREGASRVHIVLTHAHWDHLSGFPFFKPIYMKSFSIHASGPQASQESLRNVISRTMSPPYFPIELEHISAKMKFYGASPDGFEIGSIKIKTIPLSHTNKGVGYRLEEDGKSFVFLTDNELGFRHPSGKKYDDYARFSEGADLLFHDAEYTHEEYATKKGWGHSTYLDAVQLAIDAGVKKLGLFHHNQERTDQEVDRIKEDCVDVIAEKGAKTRCVAVATGTTVKL